MISLIVYWNEIFVISLILVMIASGDAFHDEKCDD